MPVSAIPGSFSLVISGQVFTKMYVSFRCYCFKFKDRFFPICWFSGCGVRRRCIDRTPHQAAPTHPTHDDDLGAVGGGSDDDLGSDGDDD